MKKFGSIFLTLAMIFSLSVPAFAAGTGTYTLTINGAAGHTYDTGDHRNYFYPIFHMKIFLQGFCHPAYSCAITDSMSEDLIGRR